MEVAAISCIINYYAQYYIPAAPHEAIQIPSSLIYASAGDNVHNQIQGELQLLARVKSNS